MCLALLALEQVPGRPLILLANRDEWHQRPAEPLHWWPDRPDIAGGRDAVAGGSWLAVHRDGRFATVLNDARIPAPAGAPSRGGLVTACLESADQAAWLDALHARRDAYAGFHLLVGRPGCGWYCGSRSERPRPLTAGLHAVGNAGPDPGDPRLCRARSRLEAALAGDIDPEALLDVLADTAAPGPGAGDTRPVFVTGDEFGTRCSTLFMVADDGCAVLHERRFDAKGQGSGDTRRHWRITAIPGRY